MFERVEIVPAYKTVCEAIEREILNGTLVPGDQLPTETELAEQFGLTRHTVREGLRILEEGGLVARESGRRLYVKQPHYAELSPRAERSLIMQRVTFTELWEVSMALEPRAALRAATRITPDQIAQLEDNLVQMQRALDADRSIIPLDVAFHTLIAEIAGNKALLLAREPISQLFYPALSHLFAHPINRGNAQRRLFQAHQHIVAALKAGDAEASETWMRRHMADFRRGYIFYGLDMDQAVSHNVPSS